MFQLADELIAIDKKIELQIHQQTEEPMETLTMETEEPMETPTEETLLTEQNSQSLGSRRDTTASTIILTADYELISREEFSKNSGEQK
jgi:hypothetical protein